MATSRRAPAALLLHLLALLGLCGAAHARYAGREVGALSQLQHGVRGRVFAVDSRTLYIQDLHYDGEGPAAYFYVGKSKAPGGGGTRLRDERGASGPLRRYRGESITLALPDGLSLKDLRWFSIWCDEFAVNFGDVRIPRELEYPRPARVGALRGEHGVRSDPVVVVDAQTLLVPHFSYDGEAPDAKFWVGRGESPSPQGIRIPDENGKEEPLRKYDAKTIVLTLPGELTVFDIGHFGVWCEAFTVDFGHIVLPRAALRNVPPSLKMLGVSPQSKLNCEVLLDELAFEARWAVAGDSIVVQLVARLEDGEYMSFGISGHPRKSQMVGGDVAVAAVNQSTLQGRADDYYLDAKSQCAGTHGACPDERLVEGTDSVRLLNAALVNRYSIVTYQRPLRAADQLDLPVLTNASQPIIWAIGPLNADGEVSYHSHYNKEDVFIEFGRPPRWNCPMPETEEERHLEQAQPAASTAAPSIQPVAVIKPRPVPPPQPVARAPAWEIPAIQCYEPQDGVFYAQMGPTGGKHGYTAITGHVGWGISWYINGLLIPEINVVRGKKYTFVVEGGSDPAVPARYHPFYITNDPVGGYQHKTAEEKKGIEIYAGVRRTRSGEVSAAGVGRLCNWTPDSSGPTADEYPSFGAYQRSLTLVCEEGQPGVVTWTPDAHTPDTVYYQCFTHRHLGWKINVVDECEAVEGEESRVSEAVALPDDLQSEESVQVHSRLTPDTNFLDQRKKLEKIINTKTNYDDFSSYKEGELTGEVYRDDREQLYHNGQQHYELPISKVQMKEVIQAVENFESQIKDDLSRNKTHSHPQGVHSAHPPHSAHPSHLLHQAHSPHNSHQYQVHENVREMFVPEQPIREDDEYFVEGKIPDNYFLPPNQKPLTLQSVLRPNGPNKPHGNVRPPFRRPVPPEIKLRRPPPMHQKATNTGYPLPMPNPHNSYHAMKKPQNTPHKYNNNNNRPPVNRPPQVGIPAGIPPMKLMPQLHSKPMFNQISKQSNKNNPSPTPQAPLMIIMANSKQGPTNIPMPTQSQTLSLGQTDIIANQVVKSHIMLPGGNDAIAQHSMPQTYTKPGQIILGKPMEHPVPLDQQMIPTKPQVLRTPPTPPPQLFQSSTLRIKLENEMPSLSEIKSSDFIGESVDSSTFAPAINTGFRPESIVVESGFKPIIREPLMAAEDRITDYESNANRREDTDVVEDYEESPQPIANYAPSSEKLTETFEPMFIPSPPDHLIAVNDRTKEVFPKNHAKEDRPHPVYVKTESELNALFSKKNMERDVPSDMVMESDRVSPHYLPPDPKLPKEQSQKLSMGEQTFTTYDGKTVSAATLTSVPDLNKTSNKFSSKLPANSELLLKTPQFGPFKGEIPPLVEAHISSSKDLQPPAKKAASTQDARNTHLKLVNLRKSSDVHLDDIKADGSEIHEVTEKPEDLDEESYEDEDVEEEEAEEDVKRNKRNARGTQFDKTEKAEQQPINGHSLPVSQINFEASAASARLLSVHLVLLALCAKLF